MFNKQKDLLVAVPLTILVGVVFGVGLMEYLRIAQVARGIAMGHGRVQDVRVARAQLPVPTVIPERRAQMYDLERAPGGAHVVIDVASGRMLLDHAARTERAVASTTKVLAAMVVTDRVRDLDQMISVPEEALAVEGTRVGCKNSYYCEGERLVAGERVSVRDLLRATLVSSANDAITALAIELAGSEAAFAELMNLRARELGLTQSEHCRPSGLDLEIDESLELEHKKCYSTAYDMAHVLRLVYTRDRYSDLRSMLAERGGIITDGDGTRSHVIATTNDALDAESGLIVAGKTGYTELAGPSLVVRAEDADGQRPIIIATYDDPERFERVDRIAQWAYAQFEWQAQ